MVLVFYLRLILEVMAISDVASPNPPFFAEIATSGSPVLILFGILPFRDKKTKAQKLVEVKMTKVTTKISFGHTGWEKKCLPSHPY